MMEERKCETRRRAAHPGALALVMLLAVAIAAAVLLNNNRWIVRGIEVKGQRLYSAQQVADVAGIALGDSMLSLDIDRVARRVNADRYLEYVALVRQWPDRVLLEVIEHSPVAMLYRQGMTVMIAADGIVLDQTAQMDVSLPVPLITGLNVTAVQTGGLLRAETPQRLETVLAVLSELEAQGLAMQIEELNVSALDNLYLVTSDGLQVMLGGDHDLSTKLKLLRGVLPRLQEMVSTVRGAVLDVSAVDHADYRPPR
ncbi:MAG: FtsQ-type POTRA domain-containing protein [Oscillospiraceae bacterium]|jgi:cell division protein FtsQ|nr:FtsQ-type POTRA domain-containing protein [Oscillospiraceae bacterium]